ncbi:neuronal PAS domain-containing protein 1 [Anguilla anguilla]|uniref:neuronal PAS domain-containing protein 1 n=1 Tax=Anguilla anguilla TaxID=7936 RepID=UPI0015AEA842|nr:neuronal PAS domain-containing protein 1 [Anguilla anguilla]XP_035240008.1 neuronal PAS domain-containing protein 1 [Anguilla anguilla]XP_035240009.1 neuronal PAS domain-containing protein 1 [Anguilla anguilla]XP_035240010.1 neuronal PAS domain-containing protein 1 [Anguilla anguilla]
MAAMPFVSEGKCVSVEWDFLQGLLAKPPTLPCLQNLRKEKSRNAARSRRGKENFEFFELAKMLPLPGAITSQLDKASVIRLTISYLHMRHFASQGDPPWGPLLEGGPNCNKALRRTSQSLASDMFEQHLGAHLLQSLDGFVFVVSHEGRFLYISETVSIYLGLSQVELTGSSVFDYIHPADHVEMAERLGIRPHLRAEAGCHQANESASSSASTSSLAETPEPAPSSPLSPEDESPDRGFFIRMKSTLTKRGLHVKSSGYKVIHVTGRIRCRPALMPGPARSLQRPLGLVALAHTLPPSTLNEVRMESQMFVFRVNMDLQVTYCENRISEYMDLSPAEVVGHTCYHFIHVEDVENVRQSHEDLLRKGQVVTGYYRWLQRRGGFLWVQSCATVSINHKAPHERNVIWVNYVLSRTELPDTPLDLLQLPESLRNERVRATPPPRDVPSQTQGASVSRPLKCLSGRSAPGSKVREPFPHPSDSQSEESRKRMWRSRAENGPQEARRLREELREARDESPSASSDAGSDSEGERRGGRGDGERSARRKRVKCEEGLGSRGGEAARGAGGRIQNGRAVIQHPKGAAVPPPPSIKTEQDFSASASASGGPRWGHPHPSLRGPPGTPNGDSPPDSTLTPPGSEAPPKGLFSPASPGLSPPMSASPLGREERCLPGGRGPDFELLQRLAAGGAAGRVLFHPLALGPQGPQSLYAPSTIRYAPAELAPAHAMSEGLPPEHPKPPPPPTFFPHLQRIAALPPFSGFSASDPPFPPGLPFCVNGLRGAAGTEED